MTGAKRPTELAAAVLAAAALALGGCGERPSPQGSISGEEATGIEETLDDVEDGAPYAYEEDGEVFRNDEALLPDHKRGYYRAYTVETPGDDDRGERRIVIGRAGEAFYTEDHYGSFISIDPGDYAAQLP